MRIRFSLRTLMLLSLLAGSILATILATWCISKPYVMIKSYDSYPLPHWLTASPDGAYFACLYASENDVWVYETNTGQIKQRLQLPPALKGCLISTEYFDDGRKLFVFPPHIVNIESGQVDAVTVLPADMKSLPTISPDGKQFAFVSENNPRRVVSIVDAASGEEQLILEESTSDPKVMPDDRRLFPINTVRFLPDNRRLVTICKSGLGDHDESFLRIWDKKTGQELNSFHIQRGHIDQLSFSSNSRYVCFSGVYSPKARIWDLEQGVEVHGAPEGMAVFLPNEEQMVSIDPIGHASLWRKVWPFILRTPFWSRFVLWFAVVCAVALVWSVLMDRRRFRVFRALTK